MANVPYSPIPTVEPSSNGSGASYGGVPEASPSAFGSQIGQAGEKLGASADDLAKVYTQRANEANANDKIVNQWAPQATGLSQAYYSKQGKDAVAGFQPYIDGLQKARSQMLENATPAESEILNQYMTRHIAQEYDGAMRHQVQQMDVYENQMSDAFVNLQTKNAVSAGSNPDMIDTAIKSGAARIQVHGLDRGQSPDEIQQQQNDFIGKTSQQVVSSAVARGDLSFANGFYANNKDNIPGAQQVDIDKTLHSENMRVFGDNAATALMNGQPIPHSPNGGADATNVRSTVASTAQSAGVDPNASLMIAGIESSFGQNVGSRGDVGQTGKTAYNLGEQAQNLVSAQKQAQDAADKAVGGKAAPWQMYTVYQQGLGGGVALLKPENANAKAVDVLSQFYKSPKDALSAIQDNGGNATMTASQFTDMLRQKCETIYGQVKCDTTSPDGKPVNLGQAIADTHQTGGITAQPGASPMQSLLEMDKVYPDLLQRANAIPNLDQRDAALRSLEQKHAVYQSAASAWKTQFMNQAQQLAIDPKFTSTDMIPPDMRSALSDNPVTLNYLESRAQYNLEHGSGVQSKDAQTYGSGVYKVMQQIHAAPDDPNRITSTDQLMQHIQTGDLTFAGYDRMAKELSGKGTPEGSAEGAQQAQTFKVIKQQLSGEDMMPGMKDPKGEEIYAHAMPLIYKAIDDGKAKGIPVSELFDPQSKNWVGNAIQSLKRSPDQYYSDMSAANLGGVSSDAAHLDAKEGQQIVSDFKSGRYSADSVAKQQGLDALKKAVSDKTISRQDAMQLAVAYGYAQASPAQNPGPQVPQAGVNE